MAATANVRAVITAQDRSAAALTGFAGKIQRTGDSVINAAKMATKALAIASAGAVAFSIKSATAYEQNRVAFDTLLGSAEDGAKMMKKLSDFARKTPFDLPEVVEGAQRLLAYNIEAEKLLPTFNALGNIAAGVGKEKLPFLILALGQVRAAGKLTGQELRQFTEAGVPLLDILAKQSGKTAAEIKEAMEGGAAPSFAEVEKAIFSASQKGGKFFNLMERQSKTLGGVVSNLRDNFGRFGRQVVGISEEGEIREGSIFARLSSAGTKFLTWLDANSEKIASGMQGMFDNALNAIDRIASAFESGGFRGALEEVKKMLNEFADKIDWKSMAQKLTEGFFNLMFAIDWEEFASQTVKLIIKVVPKIIDGIIVGLFRTAKESPMDMLQFILAIGFLPAKIVKAIGLVFRKIPFIGAIAGPLFNAFAGASRKLVSPLRNIFQSIGKKILSGLEVGLGLLKNRVFAIFGDIVNVAVERGFAFVTAYQNVIRVGFTRAGELLRLLIGGIGNIFRTGFAAVRTIVFSVFDAIASKILLFVNVVREYIGRFALNLGLTVGRAARSLLAFATQHIPNFVRSVIVWIGSLPGRIAGILGRVTSVVVSRFVSIGRSMVNLIISGVRGVIGWFGRLPGNVANIASRLWGAIRGHLSEFRINTVNWAKRVVDSVVGFFAQLPGKIASKVKGGFERAKTSITEFVSGIKIGFGGRAMGGPVNASTPYIVGEKGPELFVPQRSGKIVPNNKLRDSQATRAMGQPTVNITIQAGAFMGSQQDARRYAMQIMEAYNDAMQAKGLGMARV